MACTLLLLLGCNNGRSRPDPYPKAAKEEQKDFPNLTKNVTMRDVTFHSAALGRNMPYRVILPANTAPADKLPVVYLLHGGGPGSFRDWSNYSHVARFAERRVILVMPEGGSAFYTNSAEVSGDRYEDYITSDLVSEVESRFPAIPERESRAIVGVSLGGFGALKLALRHPSMFGFAGGISSPVDDAIRRPDPDEKLHDGVFGPWGSQRRLNNDPFFLAQSIDHAHAPYLFLMCGDREGGLSANRRFAALLTQRRFAHEFHVIPGGGHTWNEWDLELTNLFRSLLKQLRLSVALPPEWTKSTWEDAALPPSPCRPASFGPRS